MIHDNVIPFDRSRGRRDRRLRQRLAAGVVLLDADNNVLLGLRGPSLREPATWGTPGGYADPRDQSSLATALRELYEETEIMIMPDEVADGYSNVLGDITHRLPITMSSDRNDVLYSAHVIRIESIVVDEDYEGLLDPSPDGHETLDARWLSAESWLRAHDEETLKLHSGALALLATLSHTGF